MPPVRINHFRNWQGKRKRPLHAFEVGTMTAGVDSDFDQTERFEEYVVDRLKDRGTI